MEKTLDFKVIFYMLRTKIVWIIVAAIVGALAAFSISSFLLTEQFTSETQVYISNTQDQALDKVNNTDLTTSRSMASTYQIILKSKRATDLLQQKLQENEQFTSSSVQSYTMEISVVDSSEVLTFTVISEDPNTAALVCNTMVDVSIDMISDIFEGGRCNPLGEAIANYTPTSPNTRVNMVVGAMLGIALSGALIIFWFILDNRVKDESDFVQKVGIPVLGEVPSMHEDAPRGRSRKKKKGYGYYYAYTSKSND